MDKETLDESAKMWEKIKEAAEKVGLMEYTGPTFKTPPTYKSCIEVKTDEGELVMIPVSLNGGMEIEYGFGEPATILNPSFVVEALYNYGSDGSIQVFKGPFHVKGSYEAQTTPPPLPAKIKTPNGVHIEHQGIYYSVAPGDTFTVTFDLDIMGNKQQHYETVKVLDFLYPEGNAPTTKASPSLLNYEEEDDKRRRQHESNGTFSFNWLEKKECFLINGYWQDKRYEIVLAQPISHPDIHEFLGVNKRHIPPGLVTVINSCSTALRNHLKEKMEVFKHPKLHTIQVKCPHKPSEKKDEKGNALFSLDCSGIVNDLYNMIQHLNDTHRWTREAIAEWIDTLDEQPVFYPIIETERMANSAKVVVVQPPF